MKLLIFILIFSTACEGQVIRANPLYRPFAVSTGCPNDADATAWIAASGITDTTGIHCFFKGLKDYSLYTHMANSGNGGAWLLFGGSANACKYNIFSPVDADANFRLFFNNGWSFTSGGADPGNGNYAETSIIPSVNLNKDSKHLSVYSVEDNSGGSDIGDFAINNSSFDGIFLNNGGLNYYYLSDLANNSVSSGSTSLGFYIATRTASNATALYKNGTSIATSTTNSSASQNTSEIKLGVGNGQYSQRKITFASVGPGMTSGQASDLNLLVEQLMDARGIGVQ